MALESSIAPTAVGEAVLSTFFANVVLNGFYAIGTVSTQRLTKVGSRQHDEQRRLKLSSERFILTDVPHLSEAPTRTTAPAEGKHRRKNSTRFTLTPFRSSARSSQTRFGRIGKEEDARTFSPRSLRMTSRTPQTPGMTGALVHLSSCLPLPRVTWTKH